MPIAIGVPPVAPQRPASETEHVQRRDESTSGGFRPQTNVALKTAIDDLAGTLSKISSQEKFGIDKLPSDIGQIVRNILQQSLSLNQTILQGVGSTIESQRFSNDQLMLFARMLAQIGALAEKGFSMELSDETKTLLAQFKNLIVSESGGNVLEPVLMSKSAFELIDNKNPEQLPQALYEILAQLAQPATLTNNQPQQSEGMQFLNQLVKFFMPRPSSSASAQNQTQQQTQNQQTQQRPTPTPTQRLLNSMYRQLDDPYANLPKQQAAQDKAAHQNFQKDNQTQQSQQNSQPQNQTQQSQQNSQPQNQTQQSQQNSQPQNQTQQSQQNSQPQNQAQQSQQNSQPQNQTQQSQQNSQPQNQTQQSQQNSQPQNQTQQSQQNSQPQNQAQQSQQNSQPQNQTQQSQQNSQPQNQTFLREEMPQLDANFLSKQQSLKNQMQTSKNVLLKQPLQNNQQTMDTMKNLAQLLLRNNSEQMSPRDALLLQNFINNSQKMMPESEARHLQNLLRLCQQNVPSVVQQAAVQHKLPDLPRLWAFMQMCDMASLSSKMTPRGFKRAGRQVMDFANVMRNVTASDNSTVQNQRSFQMMIPLYLGDNQTSYPTYLSVYDEDVKDPDTGVEKKETWLRICVLTDNIGAAELIFRVYEGNQLDMRFYFSEMDVAQDFKTYISNLRGAIRETHFQIGEIRIGSIGERMLAS